MLSFLQSVTITILLAFLLRFFVIQPFVVEGSSMEPNFHDDQYIIIDKFSYRVREPQRGEVIVFHPPTYPDQNYIKRIIGLPNETVTIQNGEVFINNKQLEEAYLGNQESASPELLNFEPVTLGSDEYFVMGDNRNHSSDSREWGKLSKANIEGRTWFVAFPVSDFHFVQLPEYEITQTAGQGYVSPLSLDLTH